MSSSNNAIEEEVLPSLSDPRLIWLANRLVSSFRVKFDKIVASFTTEENNRALLTFLETTASQTIVFYTNQQDQIIVAPEFPAIFKKKLFYLLKRSVSRVVLCQHVHGNWRRVLIVAGICCRGRRSYFTGFW